MRQEVVVEGAFQPVGDGERVVWRFGGAFGFDFQVGARRPEVRTIGRGLQNAVLEVEFQQGFIRRRLLGCPAARLRAFAARPVLQRVDGGSFGDGLDVAVGTVVAVATKGHFWVELILDSKAAIAKGATLEASTANGGALSLSATSGTAGSNNTIYAKVLEGVAYTAASGSGSSATPEKGGEQFREVAVGGSTKYAVLVKVELV